MVGAHQIKWHRSMLISGHLGLAGAYIARCDHHCASRQLLGSERGECGCSRRVDGGDDQR